MVPAAASGILLWSMLPPVGCCHCYYLPSDSNYCVPVWSLSSGHQGPKALLGIVLQCGGMWNILMGLSQPMAHLLSPR